MTTVTVTTTANTSTATKVPRMILKSIDNTKVVEFPIAPRDVDYDGFGWTWAEIERDGRTPYLVSDALQLPTVKFTANLAYSMEPDRSVIPLMTMLKDMANSTTSLTLKYGGWFDTRLWKIDSLSFSTKQRHYQTDAPTWVEADITLKGASDITLTVGPVSGGKKTPAKKTTTKKTKYKYYKIKKGDTLIKLANKFYGDPGKWKQLAKLNKIKGSQTKKLKVGKKIKY